MVIGGSHSITLALILPTHVFVTTLRWSGKSDRGFSHPRDKKDGTTSLNLFFKSP